MISLDFGQFEKLDFYHLPAHCAGGLKMLKMLKNEFSKLW